jgi:hypothetical protein
VGSATQARKNASSVGFRSRQALGSPWRRNSGRLSGELGRNYCLFVATSRGPGSIAMPHSELLGPLWQRRCEQNKCGAALVFRRFTKRSLH